ncbi:Protein YLS3 [Glycine soja]|uniref:Protein YLS3 n=2 Tax=Glycine soja TaxID=3848 RepID=A0A445FM01_GLYSO|nr:Protein YLS3 [Glycine soja]
MKLWERVIERRLRKETQVTENQFGFMPGRSTMEAIYLLRRVMEQYRMAQQDLHLIFIDLEKAYDRVPREILWKALEKKGVRVAYIRAIQDMYDRVSTSVRTQGGESDDFPITIGLHQGSTLSPYLFTLILDVLTEQIQEIVPRCMLFADDIVLLGESREELNERLETWRRALETHGFRLSRSKSEYMECKFNKRRRVSNSEVKIGDHIIPQVTWFKYLGSVIQDDGEIEGDVNHRIQAGWMKWRKASGVLCDAKVPIKLKGKFYRTAVRPAILYGTECWAVKSQHENKVGVAEMRMLRWMCGKTRQDKIRNEAIRERVGVTPIVEKMVENRLRWFGHVERRPVDSVVRRVDQMERRQTIREQQQKVEGSHVNVNVTSCGIAAKTPTIDCCSGLKMVLEKSKKCICILIKDRDDPNLGIKINATLAIQLPTACHAPANNITQCVDLLHLVPNSPDAKVFEGFQKSSKTNSSSSTSVSSGAEKGSTTGNKDKGK